MEAEFKSTQGSVPHPLSFFKKMAKSAFSIVLIFVYVPYSINDYIWANLNFQKNRSILFLNSSSMHAGLLKIKKVTTDKSSKQLYYQPFN